MINGSLPAGFTICKEKTSPTGFKNGEISWDGTYQGTSYTEYHPTELVRYGTFKWELTLWNCTTPDAGQSTFNMETLTPLCDEYKWKVNINTWLIKIHSGKYCSHTSIVYGNPVSTSSGIITIEVPHN